jgi:hypothetical protein
MASRTVCRAVSNPNVKSVNDKSLPIVLGTRTIFIPFWKFVANLLPAVTADGDDGVDSQLLAVGKDIVRDVAHNFPAVLFRLVFEGIAAVRSAQNRSAVAAEFGLLDRASA